MPTLTIEPGLSLYHEVRGQGPALVLLNGMSQSTANWMSQVRPLCERFKVITWDARGQGRSDIGPAPLTLERHAADLTRLLDALEVERAHLCGFSYGARVALAFAARSPDRVDRLVLTSLGSGQSSLRRLIVRSWREVLDRGGLEAMAWASLPHILGEIFLAQYERQIPAMIQATLSRNTEAGIRALLDGLDRAAPAEEDAARVTAPALVISADQDPLVSLASATGLAAAFADGRHALIEGYGHTLPVEAPARWRALVEGFLT